MKYLTTPQLAERWSCHAETVRRKVQAGSLPAYKITGKLRFKESDIEAYEESMRVKVKPTGRLEAAA